ncbi:MAG: hypothetical protein JWR69_2585 [Pedosphaera sp.]|nr:hypothetical protein [Pedosphaera sp.]
MNMSLKSLGKVSESFICMIGYLAIIGFTADHWPAGYVLVRYILLVALGLLYFWRFFVQPLRAGLRKKDDNARPDV